MNSAPQLFLFDLDGTLIDSRADLAAATNAMRALHGLPPLPLDAVTAYVGDGIRVLAARALEGAAVDSDLAAREISAAYAAHLTDRTTAYPGVDAGLRGLQLKTQCIGGLRAVELHQRDAIGLALHQQYLL